MAGRIDSKLAELGIELPNPKAPVANYVPFVRTGNLLFVSGQVSLAADGPINGQLSAADHVEGAPPAGSKLATAMGAARVCGLNMIAQVKAATGDLDKVVRVVKLTGFVNSTPDFADQPKVINGASDTLVAILGDKGRHARSAVSAASLPFGVAVEIEGIFEVG